MSLPELFLALALVAAAPDGSSAPVVTAGPQGFAVASADEAYRLQLRALVQVDFRSFFGPTFPEADRSTFLVRSAAPILEVTVARQVRGRIFVNFAESRVALLDAYVEADLVPGGALTLRAGKFAPPLSEERLTPIPALPFVQPSVSAFLLPLREIGVQILGNGFGGIVAYNLALVNGGIAGSSLETDSDSGKDLMARILLRPFRTTPWEALRTLGLGLGASTGERGGTVDSPQTLSLRTYGGQPWFSFRNDRTQAGTAILNGTVQRLVPHGFWSVGPVAVYGDAVLTQARVSGREVRLGAWSAVANVVLTGERAEPLTVVVPLRPLDFSRGSFGAIALVGGLGEISVDPDVFPTLADPSTSMRRARTYGAGLNWYPVGGVALITSFGHTRFLPAVAGVPARPPENTFVARLQVAL